MSSLKGISDAVTQMRVAWLTERPERDSYPDLLTFLRAEYRYHRDAKESLERTTDTLRAMIEDCEERMQYAQETAGELTS